MAQTDGTETEVKLRVADVETARRLVRDLGGFLAQPRHFEDNQVFDDENERLASTGCLLRLRSTSAGNSVTFKGPKTLVEGLKRREEVESRIDDPAALRAILERLGLRATFRYQKYREVYESDAVEVVVDETPIGVFIEIEGPIEEIHAAARAMGFGPESYVSESYAELFFADGGQGDMVFA